MGSVLVVALGCGGSSGGETDSGPCTTDCDAAPALGVEVETVLTADNRYAFGWGSESSLASYFTDNMPDFDACEIFCCPVGGPDGDTANGRGPERYLIPPKDTVDGNFLYIIAWADRASTQGVLGRFRRADGLGTPIYTGIGDWEVCATGEDFGRNDAGPTQAQVDLELAHCNAGDKPIATSSGGWVNPSGAVTQGAVGALEIGEDNSSAGGEFPLACQDDVNGYGIDADARWMWYNWDPSTVTNPFDWPGGSANLDKRFLIFRLPLRDVVVID